MEFDCRVDNPDEVKWECKLTLPDGEVVNLKFRDFAKVPSKISMNNIGDDERQLWLSLDWGLIEPEHWPTDSKRLGVNVFAEVPASIAMDIHREWQKKSGVTQGESPASKTSSESTDQS
jgi:hypothetical protein